GRAPVLMKEVSKKLNIDSYISMNGQYIVHEGEVIYANPIEMPLVEQVVEVANERQDGILLSTADEIIANSLISLACSVCSVSSVSGSSVSSAPHALSP